MLAKCFAGLERGKIEEKFCSIYIHYRHQNRESQYTVDKTVGAMPPEVNLRKGAKILRLNGTDLSYLTAEEFYGLLIACQHQLSLAISQDEEGDELHQEAVSGLCLCGDDSCEVVTLIVTLQDADIKLLSTDSEGPSFVEANYQDIMCYICKSIQLVDQAEGSGRYLGWTTNGPQFIETGATITMLCVKHTLVALQFNAQEFLKYEQKEGTDELTLETEKNTKLSDLILGKNVFSINNLPKSFFFIKIHSQDNTYQFRSALYSDYFLCSNGDRLVLQKNATTPSTFQMIKQSLNQ